MSAPPDQRVSAAAPHSPRPAARPIRSSQVSPGPSASVQPTDLNAKVLTAAQCVNIRAAWLRDTPGELQTKNISVKLVGAVTQVLTPGEEILMELGGPSALALALPGSETEVYIGFKEFAHGRAWEDTRLDQLEPPLQALCDVNTFAREPRCLKFTMAGVRIRFSIGALKGQTNKMTAWRRYASDPNVRDLSLVVLEAVAADSTMTAAGFTPWVVIGLVSIFVARRRSAGISGSLHDDLRGFLLWTSRQNFTHYMYDVAVPMETRRRDPSPTSPMFIASPVSSTYNLAAQATKSGVDQLRSMSCRWLSLLSSNDLMSLLDNCMLPLSPQEMMKRATALPIPIISLPRYVNEVMARAVGLASRRVSSASHTAPANPPSFSRQSNTHKPPSRSQTLAARSTMSERQNSSTSDEPAAALPDLVEPSLSNAVRPAARVPVPSAPRSASSTSPVSSTPATHVPIPASRNVSVSVVPQSSMPATVNPPTSNGSLASTLHSYLKDTLPKVPAPRVILALSSGPTTNSPRSQDVSQARIRSKRPASLSSTSVSQSPTSKPSVAKRSRVKSPKKATQTDAMNGNSRMRSRSPVGSADWSYSEEDDIGFWDTTGNPVLPKDTVAITEALPGHTCLPVPRTSGTLIYSSPVPVRTSGSSWFAAPRHPTANPPPVLPVSSITSPRMVVQPLSTSTGLASTDTVLYESRIGTQSSTYLDAYDWADTDDEDIGFYDPTGNVVPSESMAPATRAGQADADNAVFQTNGTPLTPSPVPARHSTSAAYKASGSTADAPLAIYMSHTPSPQEVAQPLLANPIPLSIASSRPQPVTERAPPLLRVRIPAQSSSSAPGNIRVSSATSSESSTSSWVIAGGSDESSGPDSASSGPHSPVETAADSKVRVVGGDRDSDGGQQDLGEQADDNMVDKALLEAALILAGMAGARPKTRD